MMKMPRPVGLIIGLVFGFSIVFQAWQFYKFMGMGPRFTASDGVALCLRIQKLEKLSYGYRDAGYVPLDCDYLTREIDK